jgi:hypothetical protein
MRAIYQSASILGIFLFLALFNTSICFSGQLIEPTRTLEGGEKATGSVTVFSEPPELEVFLDGSKVGQTPLWLERVSQGFHKLRVKDVEKEIHLEAGKGLRVGLLKGDFVVFPEKEKKLQEQPAERKVVTEAEAPVETPEKRRSRDLTLWERFVNGTLNHF